MTDRAVQRHPSMHTQTHTHTHTCTHAHTHTHTHTNTAHLQFLHVSGSDNVPQVSISISSPCLPGHFSSYKNPELGCCETQSFAAKNLAATACCTEGTVSDLSVAAIHMELHSSTSHWVFGHTVQGDL